MFRDRDYDPRKKKPVGRDRFGRFVSNDPAARLARLNNAVSYTRQASYKYKKVCPVCNKEFNAARSSRVTCSDSCRGKKSNTDKKRRKLETLPESARKYLEQIACAVPTAGDYIHQLLQRYDADAALLALNAIADIYRAKKQTTQSSTTTTTVLHAPHGNTVKRQQ